MNSSYQQELEEHLEVMRSSATLESVVLETAQLGVERIQQGGKFIFCGNGGSAADSQHLAAELVVRYRRNRVALPAMALTTDVSMITATGNDYDFSQIFARQVEALGRPGDILVAISTSGTSPNVVEAGRRAKQIGLTVVGVTGLNSSPLGDLSDLHWAVPSVVTARIQECYLFLGHMLCGFIENHWVQEGKVL